jgi:hypothetical protein
MICKFIGLLDPDCSIIIKQQIKKTLISTVLWLLIKLLSLKTDVNLSSVNKKLKTLGEKLTFVGILKKKRAGSGAVIQWYRSDNQDPNQNVTDPEQWQNWAIFKLLLLYIRVRYRINKYPKKKSRERGGPTEKQRIAAESIGRSLGYSCILCLLSYTVYHLLPHPICM